MSKKKSKPAPKTNARVSPNHLTKSLHTLTTVKAVAALMVQPRAAPLYRTPEALLREVLENIGQTRYIDFTDPTDTTVVKCLEACREILSQQRAKGAA